MREVQRGFTSAQMKAIALVSSLGLALLLVSCRKQPAEVEISQTRPLTSHDDEPAVDATSAEQFLPPDILRQIQDSGQKIPGAGEDSGSTSSWTYRLPAADWKEEELKPMREINLSFGEGENEGEIYLSLVGGGLQPNVDRWFRQFGNATKPLAELGQLDFLGQKGYLIEASGRYEPGMGRPGKDGQALLGAMVEYEGRLATIKMIGPEDEIATRREQFLKFVASVARK